jgi:hypothetical protein
MAHPSGQPTQTATSPNAATPSYGHLVPLSLRQGARNADYFAEDQLKYSEAVSDFISVRGFMTQTAGFNLANLFRYALVTAPSPRQ